MSDEMKPETASAELTGETGASKEDVERLSKVDRIFVRLNVLNTVLAIAGLFTGAVALYAALTESEAVRKQSAAAVWPFVQFSTSDRINEDGPYFSMQLTNAGVGPAKIESVRIEIDGEARENWQEVVAALVPDSQPRFGMSFSLNRVLRPGEQVRMIETQDAELQKTFVAATLDPVNRFTYCYCSIFDECWLADSAKNVQKPEPVAQCPDYGDEAFLN